MNAFYARQSWRAFLFAFDIVFEHCQEFDGVARIPVDPAIVYVADRDCVQVIPPEASLFLRDDEACPFENAEVLHHSAAVDLFEVVTDVPGRSRFVFQEIEDLAAAAVGQRFVNEIIFFCA